MLINMNSTQIIIDFNKIIVIAQCYNSIFTMLLFVMLFYK